METSIGASSSSTRSRRMVTAEKNQNKWIKKNSNAFAIYMTECLAVHNKTERIGYYSSGPVSWQQHQVTIDNVIQLK